MKIRACHSHFNGLEYLLIQAPRLWKELQRIIDGADVDSRGLGQPETDSPKYSGARIGNALLEGFQRRGWSASGARQLGVVHGVQRNIRSARDTVPDNRFGHMRSGFPQKSAPRQVMKDRVAVEFRFEEGLELALDFHSRSFALYADDMIDVGVAVTPTRVLQSQMSPDLMCYDEKLEIVLARQRRAPAVPLVLVGIEP